MSMTRRLLLAGTFAFGLLLLGAVTSGQNFPYPGKHQRNPRQPVPQSSTGKPLPLPPPGNPPSLAAIQSMLVSRIHIMNQMEIKAGHLAASKGSTPAMREYGERLAMDHSAADRKIVAYAKAHHLQLMSPAAIESNMQKKEWTIPQPESEPKQMQQQGISLQNSTPPQQQFQQQMAATKSKMQQLQTLQGNAFDAAFTTLMMQSHRQAIAMLSMGEGALPVTMGLHSMISGMLPVLEQHYEIASRLEIATIRRQNADLGNRLQVMMRRGK